MALCTGTAVVYRFTENNDVINTTSGSIRHGDRQAKKARTVSSCYVVTVGIYTGLSRLFAY